MNTNENDTSGVTVDGERLQYISAQIDRDFDRPVVERQPHFVLSIHMSTCGSSIQLDVGASLDEVATALRELASNLEHAAAMIVPSRRAREVWWPHVDTT